MADDVFNTYFFEKNLQGDIIAIFKGNGAKIGTYCYDAWGNVKTRVSSGITALEKNIVQSYNPFRYRGYYYDTESGLYYLQSRYYNPQWGRFLNADGYTSTGTGLLGYNMYAYCNNNPVMYVDPNGNWLFDRIGEAIVKKVIEVGKNIVEDVENYDEDNTDEQVVLKSNYFSSYKGKLVLRIGGNRSGSFGILFITRETNGRENPEDVIRHEYGHTVQLDKLGAVKYALCIGLPSVGGWGSKDYYDKPWELTADIYGDVQSRTHKQSDINEAYEYMWLSEAIGPFVWRKIK